MVSQRILAFVLAGGEGTRLRPLTDEHCKPALSFAGGRRLIDFVLSNLVNSHVDAIYVLAQYRPQSLVEHLAEAWGACVRVLLPGAGEGAAFRGTAHAVQQNLDVLQRERPDLVAVFAADHVFRMDLRQMAAFHRARGAQATVGAVAVPIAQAHAFGVIAAGADGAVHDFQEKPRRPKAMPGDPRHAYASMGNYLFEPRVLIQMLDELGARGGSDFGHDVLPRMPGRYRLYAYDFADNVVPGVRPYEERAYWRDVGTLQALLAAREDVRGPRARFSLRNPSWPIHGRHEQERNAA